MLLNICASVLAGLPGVSRRDQGIRSPLKMCAKEDGILIFNFRQENYFREFISGFPNIASAVALASGMTEGVLFLIQFQRFSAHAFSAAVDFEAGKFALQSGGGFDKRNIRNVPFFLQ